MCGDILVILRIGFPMKCRVIPKISNSKLKIVKKNNKYMNI